MPPRARGRAIELARPATSDTCPTCAACTFPSSAAARAADKGVDGERILIVDDHPLTREALASLLEQHGFDVVGQASDGAEAIELAAELRPISSCST